MPLKACIARQTQRHEFPDNNKVRKSWTHALNDLVNVAGLKDELQERTNTDFDFLTNWGIVASWSEESRYRRHRPESAHELVKAVDERRHDPMDKTALVSIDLEIGSELLQALDRAGLRVQVALWANLAEYQDWRLILSARKLDSLGIREG
jgi:hypothetical protein